jgi:flagellin
MSLGVLNNLNAIYAENNLNTTSNNLSTVLQQLSSGSKINSGADDAAGLSLVNGLQANNMALAQSQTNASEGVGLLTVADGALSQVTNLLNRAVTLATEASNGTLNTSQDTAANQEYQSILSEISNIGSTTTYNNQAVFGTATNIFTGDSSTTGASVDNLNIRSLSASNVGDTGGQMAYSSGTDNVFVDLSKNGTNAAVTDSLGTATQTTTLAVSYLSKGANGAAVTASANISVGAGTNYANSAQGLINAINNSGLGITASFGTAAQAGSAAAATANAANDTNSALLTGTGDTGIIISGAGVGVSTDQAYVAVNGNIPAVPEIYTDGAGEVGTLTASNASDVLGGSLTVVGSDGVSHAITLGTANSTDTLANLAATINASGYGVTASINTTSTTDAAGTFAAGTVLTFTSASSAVTVAGTGITDEGAAATTLTLGAASGTQTALGYTLGSITANASSDTLTGVLAFTTSGTVGNHTAFNLNLDGGTLTSLFNSTNGTAKAALTADNITATVNAAGTAVVFNATAASSTGATMALFTNSLIQDSAQTTGTAVVAQTAVPANNENFGTVTVTNANDLLTGGTLKIAGQTVTLGTSGQTDNLADLASYITTNLTAENVTASVNAAGTVMTLSGTTLADNTVYGTGVTTSLSLTGTPTSGQNDSTTIGSLTMPAGSTTATALSGTLAFGTESITLGTAATASTAGTATIAELAQTINSGNYGVTAALSNNGLTMTLTSTDANNDLVTPTITGTGHTAFVLSTANQGVTNSQYYSIGISGSVSDTSTGGGTAYTSLSLDRNGSSGTATISYSDTAGQSLSNTGLTTQTAAQATLTALNKAIADVAAQDGYIGAQINTLDAVSSVLSTQAENVTSAQNAVQATDYASATSNMSKYQILSQTGISALAQANTMQQEVTKLLQ